MGQMGQMGRMAVAPNMNKKPFDVRKEFVAIAATFSNYLVLASCPGLPQQTLPEMASWSKANPGKLRLAISGEGGFPHLAMELLRDRTGFQRISYKGSSQIPTDLISGRVELAIAGCSSRLPYIRSGNVHAIATTGSKRSSYRSNVTKLPEQSPGFTTLGWFGFFGRRGEPKPVIVSINRAVDAALSMPEVLERARAIDPIPEPGSAHEFPAVWTADRARWERSLSELETRALVIPCANRVTLPIPAQPA